MQKFTSFIRTEHNNMKQIQYLQGVRRNTPRGKILFSASCFSRWGLKVDVVTCMKRKVKVGKRSRLSGHVRLAQLSMDLDSCAIKWQVVLK